MVRSLVACAIALLASTASAADNGRSVTVLLDFRGDASPRAVDALQTELTKLMRPAGIEFGYRIGSELGPGPEPTDIVVVRFKGKCRRDAVSPLLDESGPFAITHVSHGEILPFAEVACDRVRTSIRSITNGNVTDDVLGRALARVVAHEMFHIFAGTPHHGEEGVARHALTSRDLTADNIRFAEHDLRKFTKR
jgi:hypothetical protein